MLRFPGRKVPTVSAQDSNEDEKPLKTRKAKWGSKNYVIVTNKQTHKIFKDFAKKSGISMIDLASMCGKKLKTAKLKTSFSW